MKSEFDFDYNKNEFVNALNTYNKKIEEIKTTFKEISSTLNELKNENVWNSDTSREISGNVDDICKSFDNANDEFESYRDYLVKVLESYDEEENKTNKKINDNVENLDR